MVLAGGCAPRTAVLETQHLCPAPPSRGGLPGPAGVTTRPAGYLQVSRGSSTDLRTHAQSDTFSVLETLPEAGTGGHVRRPPPPAVSRR
jgi:hypothetical protein